jgi:hypothetical protein
MRNLAAAQPDRVRSLSAAWLAWAKRTNVEIGRDPFKPVPATKNKNKAKS